MVIAEQAFLERIQDASKDLPKLESVVVVDGEGGDHTLDQLMEMNPEFDPAESVESIGPDDLLTLIYTSGTTGPPKGRPAHPPEPALRGGDGRRDDRAARARRQGDLVAPAAHVAERNAHYYLPVTKGVSVTVCSDPRRIAEFLPKVNPTWFFAVPRIFEKLKASLEAAFAGLPDEQRASAQKGLEASLEKVRLEQAGEEIPAEVAGAAAQADEQMFSQLRKQLGLDEALAVNVGAAPTPLEVLEFFHAIGIPIGELWGMSETCGLGTINPPDKIKLGTVGPPTPGVEIKLDDDGEVLVKADCVMPGYRNLPEKNQQAFTDDGWLRTGDIGEIDEDGYLRIVDRKKELIINAAGKNMSPANIESHLKAASPLIGQAAAIGNARPYNAALIVLDPEYAPVWAKKNGPRGEVARGTVAGGEGPGCDPGCRRPGKRQALPRRADQEVHDPARAVGAGRRRADPNDEAQAQADRREVRRGDRGALLASPRSGVDLLDLDVLSRAALELVLPGAALERVNRPPLSLSFPARPSVSPYRPHPAGCRCPCHPASRPCRRRRR